VARTTNRQSRLKPFQSQLEYSKPIVRTSKSVPFVLLKGRQLSTLWYSSSGVASQLVCAATHLESQALAISSNSVCTTYSS
jgi:hypothetical protein